MNAILIAIGSHGDVHPFVGIGVALRARGHRVTLAANEIFGSLAQSAGLEFAPLGSAEDFRRSIDNPDLWHPTRGFKVVMDLALAPLMRPTYEIIAARNVPGETFVAASSLALGARVAQDHLAIPTATVHLAPAILRSVFDTPKLPGLITAPWLPKWMKRMQYALADKVLIDPICAPLVNAFRAELKLPPVRGILRDYWNSPRLVIGLFPEWFAPPQPDWMPQLRLTGFPLYDERDGSEFSQELRDFLDAGDAPIAFTPGSANVHGREFFDAGVAACAALGKRAMLLTRHREQVPPNLPAGARHFDYAPFSQILPRCAALVHHGGIGTMAQALAAGTPQVVMALSHDQFDNARRVETLGVGVGVSSRRLDREILPAIRRLLDSDDVKARCASVTNRFHNVDPIGQTCALLESLLQDETRPFGAAATRGGENASVNA